MAVARGTRRVWLAACVLVGTVLASGSTSAYPAQLYSSVSGPVINCAMLSGTDPGEKLASCISRLTNGGVADARMMAGNFNLTQSIVLSSSGVAVLLPARSTITLQDGVTIDITASYVRIEGSDLTTTLALGMGSAIRIGRPGAPVWGWEVNRMSIQPAAGKHTTTAIYLASARAGFLERLKVSGFWGGAIDVADDCWSNRSIENEVVQNDIGYNFHGGALNAWNIRGGTINSNRIGLNFDLGDGVAQGNSISDGTQLEDNKDTAVAVKSGVIQGLFFSDIYSELFKTERLIKAEPDGKPLHLNMMSIVNAYVFSESTPPVSVQTRPNDVANVSVAHLLLRHSQHQLPIAEASGSNTSLVVSESTSTSSAHEFSTTLINNRGASAVTVRGGNPTR